MREVGAEGLELCRLQARVFEASANYMPGSSAIFIRRFMYSSVAARWDRGVVSFENRTVGAILTDVYAEYGRPAAGSSKMGPEQLHWIGYLYRYWAYRYEMPSCKIYKIVSGNELNGLFYSYHTFDVEQAIERIAESRGIVLGMNDIARGVEALRKIRISASH